MNSPLAKLVAWQQRTGQLDGWTAYHLAAGAFLCKIFQWLNCSDFLCVFAVFVIGVLWEVFEWVIEDWSPYGSKKKWFYNTASDIFVATTMAWCIVL